MRIGTAVASIIYLNIGCLTRESMEVSPKITFSSDIVLQNAFINRFNTFLAIFSRWAI
jgi:hypothetical protein